MPDWTSRQPEGGVPADASFVTVNAEGDLTGEQLLSALALMKANNLSDLPAAVTARNNLGLGTAAVEDVGTGAGNIVQLDGTGKLPAVNGSLLTNLPGGSGVSWLVKTIDYTAASGENVFVDTTGGVVTLTLPATPSAAHFVNVKSGPAANTNNVTIGRNGSTIMGSAENMTISTPNIEVTFIYDGTTWRI